MSITDVLIKFIAVFKINTATHTRIPAKAFLTIGRSEKLPMNVAIIVIIINDGVTKPRVANIPPIFPFLLCPIKVAVFTAITPGVH